MPTQIAMVHAYKVYRLRKTEEVPAGGEFRDHLSPEELAELLSDLSAQGRLGPMINIVQDGDPAVIVGQLTGMIGLQIDATIQAPVGQALPPPPGAARGNRR